MNYPKLKKSLPAIAIGFAVCFASSTKAAEEFAKGEQLNPLGLNQQVLNVSLANVSADQTMNTENNQENYPVIAQIIDFGTGAVPFLATHLLIPNIATSMHSRAPGFAERLLLPNGSNYTGMQIELSDVGKKLLDNGDPYGYIPSPIVINTVVFCNAVKALANVSSLVIRTESVQKTQFVQNMIKDARVAKFSQSYSNIALFNPSVIETIFTLQNLALSLAVMEYNSKTEDYNTTGYIRLGAFVTLTSGMAFLTMVKAFTPVTVKIYKACAPVAGKLYNGAKSILSWGISIVGSVLPSSNWFSAQAEPVKED